MIKPINCCFYLNNNKKLCFFRVICVRMTDLQPSSDSFAPNNLIIPGLRPLVKEIFLAIALKSTSLGTP